MQFQGPGYHFSDKSRAFLARCSRQLAYWPSSGLVHKDINSLNLVLTSAQKVKLGDCRISFHTCDERFGSHYTALPSQLYNHYGICCRPAGSLAWTKLRCSLADVGQVFCRTW